ncbi:MAG TPA: DUF5131 family protein [Puia sp.]|nr:DUF5131 family protein [Puia sp.]
MGTITSISWTDATWNIARGCTKVDEDCKFCYMYRDSMEGTRYDPKDIVRTKTVFDMPLKYKNTRSECWDGPPLLFTSSLTDWGHPAIDPYRHEMWDIIRQRKDLIFQLLTKRIDRYKTILPPNWGNGWDNVWLGTSVGSPAGLHRAEILSDIPAAVRFISFEPLHGHIETNWDLSWIMSFGWVIIGGESGNENGKYRYRPCDVEWMEELAYAFDSCGVPVFVKQMGTHLSKVLGMSDRHGSNIDEFPLKLRLRKFPNL